MGTDGFLAEGGFFGAGFAPGFATTAGLRSLAFEDAGFTAAAGTAEEAAGLSCCVRSASPPNDYRSGYLVHAISAGKDHTIALHCKPKPQLILTLGIRAGHHFIVIDADPGSMRSVLCQSGGKKQSHPYNQDVRSLLMDGSIAVPDERMKTSLAGVGRTSNDEIAPRPPPVGVPRRFGLGSLFVLTTFSSGVFFLAQALNMPRSVIAMIAVFFVIIGAAQWIIGEGRRARWASVIAGGVPFSMFTVSAALISQTGNSAAPTGLAFALYVFVLLIPSIAMGLAVGGMLGYLAGTLIAGVFLVAHMADDCIARRNKPPLPRIVRDRDLPSSANFVANNLGERAGERGPERT